MYSCMFIVYNRHIFSIRHKAPIVVFALRMFVRAVVVGACMFACIQDYWNGPMGLKHGGAVL